MTPIETNKPLFFNLDGEPLNGTIYIGQPNTDPRTNPKTVTFRDSGGSEFTASQPLNTTNGRIVYNGKPIVALVESEYSLLSFDEFGAQVEYDKSVTPAGSSSGGIADFSEVARVGLTLSDIKQFDVSVGDVVRNSGKTIATDRKGKLWLVISASGTPGDDISLIDFSNGLQGVAITSYQETVSLGGDFDSNAAIVLTISGGIVSGYLVDTVTNGNATHSSSSTPTSGSGVIPSIFRPDKIVSSVYGLTNSEIRQINVSATGEVDLEYRDFSGSLVNLTSAGNVLITYSVGT